MYLLDREKEPYSFFSSTSNYREKMSSLSKLIYYYADVLVLLAILVAGRKVLNKVY